MIRKTPDPDVIWQALADATRRRLVELLADGPQTTGDLAEQFARLSRTTVMKHLGLLEAAGIVRARRSGRVRWNQLDPAPIRKVCAAWIEQHARRLASAMQRLKTVAEKMAANEATASAKRRKKPAQGPRQ
jgi:DNA-binding transcriptional ArsR family regulator